MTAFTIPKSELPTKRKEDENRFPFKLKANGKTHSVPKLQFLSREGAKTIESSYGTKTEADLVRLLIKVECPDAYEEVDALEEDQAEALSVAWAAASRATVGESGASDGS